MYTISNIYVIAAVAVIGGGLFGMAVHGTQRRTGKANTEQVSISLL